MTVNLLEKAGGALRSFQQSFLKSSETSGITVSYITDEVNVTRLYQDIIVRCFPEGDTGTVEELMEELAEDESAVIVAKEGNEILGGVVISHYWSTGKKIMLVSWLAVHENHRGRNIGTLLVEEAVAYARNNEASLLLGQVEDPDVFNETNSSYGNPMKRVQFYSRFGCQRLEVPSYIPAFYEYQEPVFGVMLMLFPLSEEQRTATKMFMPELSVFVDELVGQDEGEESRAFVEACEGTVALTSFSDLY